MAWLSTAPSEWTIDGVDYVRASVPFSITGVTVMYRWQRTSTRKHKGGMTQACAEAEAAAYKTANPSHEISVNRENEAGAYRVDVIAPEISTWTPE